MAPCASGVCEGSCFGDGDETHSTPITKLALTLPQSGSPFPVPPPAFVCAVEEDDEGNRPSQVAEEHKHRVLAHRLREAELRQRPEPGMAVTPAAAAMPAPQPQEVTCFFLSTHTARFLSFCVAAWPLPLPLTVG